MHERQAPTNGVETTKRTRNRAGALLLVAAAFALPSSAQEPASSAGRSRYAVTRAIGEIRVDGRLDEAAWAGVYRDTERWWGLYQLAEKLVDLDDALAAWRHKHVLTVSRIIGGKRGTGGTAGAAYLHSTLGKRAFPELWTLRTSL